jgi:2-polyprenyl-3-methyl-5-hydroxy-6-metoxy-1,4-benzoquinol methylase
MTPRNCHWRVSDQLKNALARVIHVRMSSKDHWESVYQSKQEQDFSWTQANPELSLCLISEAHRGGSVIDVGGGASALAGRLLEAGYSVAVLDISRAALERSSAKLGTRAEQVRWIVTDVTAASELGAFDVWHDRAVFHFLTEPSQRAAYVALLSRSIPIGAHAIIATFAPDGPEKCSGLPVRRYDASLLSAELGEGFSLMKSVPEMHKTPCGKLQSFQYSVFRRT